MRARILSASAMLSILGMVSNSLPASAQPHSSELRCTVSRGFGLIVGDDRGVTCVYYRADGMVEFYTGRSSRVGFDLGPTNPQRLAFHVSAVDPTLEGALQGGYAGVAVGSTLGEGLSTQALAGGVSGGTLLLPIGNPNYTGVNFAIGAGILTLHYAGHEPHALEERY